MAELEAGSTVELLEALAGALTRCNTRDIVWIRSTVTDGLLDVIAPRLGDIGDSDAEERILEDYLDSGGLLSPSETRTSVTVDPRIGILTDRYVAINSDIYTLVERPNGSRLLYHPHGIPHLPEGAEYRSLLWGSWDNGWGDGSFAVGLYGRDILEVCDEHSDGDSVPDVYKLEPAPPDTESLVRLVVETAKGHGTGSVGLLEGLMMDVNAYWDRFKAAVNYEPAPSDQDDRIGLGIRLTGKEKQIAARLVAEHDDRSRRSTSPRPSPRHTTTIGSRRRSLP